MKGEEEREKETGSFFFLILDRGRESVREKETLICCSTYLCIHLLILARTLTRDQTHNLGTLGRCSNQLSYLTRVTLDL